VIPVVEQAYSYVRPSTLRPGGGGRLELATSGGTAPDARLFIGTIRNPDLVADGLLTVATVARSRFHVPAAMLARILLAADPIVTVADERLRFESLSACCGAYARLDLLPGAVDGEVLGRGTTNVDAGPELRAALARADAGSELSLEIGSDSISVRSDGAEVRERRVPLPARWLRGLTELAAIQSELERRATLDRADAVRLLRTAMALPPNRPAWLTGTGTRLRVAHHAAAGAAAAGGIGRLRVLERMLRHLRTLTVYAGRDGITAWQTDLGDSRLTVVLSPEAWRGFSGEGRLLGGLASDRTALVPRVRAELRWQHSVDAGQVAGALDVSTSQVLGALALLSTAGVVGYDLADGAYFHRELPYDLGQVERRQPRLADARRIVAAGRVRIDEAGENTMVAWVQGTGTEHRVQLDDSGWSCTCPWYGRHRADRGPCKHVLAAQIVLTDHPNDA
jgi:hypothetical protein